jgi:hypothetical protein
MLYGFGSRLRGVVAVNTLELLCPVGIALLGNVLQVIESNWTQLRLLREDDCFGWFFNVLCRS